MLFLLLTVSLQLAPACLWGACACTATGCGCSGAGDCTATCNDTPCTLDCAFTLGGTCQFGADAKAQVDCHNTGTCSATLRRGGTAQCRGFASCDFTCDEQCLVTCLTPLSCGVRCRPGLPIVLCGNSVIGCGSCGGARFDAGGFDAGGFDAGGFDAGSLDAGSFDAGSFDAGSFDDPWAYEPPQALTVGCGCDSAPAALVLCAVGLASARRRRR